LSASVFAPTWEVFAALRFITGISCNGMYLTAFTLLTEWVPDGWRAMVGTGAYTCLFAGGEIALAGMAFMLEGHNWQVAIYDDP
jgi:MFS family permease